MVQKKIPMYRATLIVLLIARLIARARHHGRFWLLNVRAELSIFIVYLRNLVILIFITCSFARHIDIHIFGIMIIYFRPIYLLYLKIRHRYSIGPKWVPYRRTEVGINQRTDVDTCDSSTRDAHFGPPRAHFGPFRKDRSGPGRSGRGPKWVTSKLR